MAGNFQLKNDEIRTVVIHVVDAAGDIVPAPAGDQFSVASSSQSLNAVMGTDTTQPPEFMINATVIAGTDYTLTVSDSAGLTVGVYQIDIVGDDAPAAIVADFAGSTATSQPVPTNPGP